MRSRHFLSLISMLALFCAAPPLPARDFDLMLLLDESGSMRKTDPRNARKDAANLFLRLCRPEHRVGLVGFSTEVRILSDLKTMGPGSDRDALISKVRKVQSSGLYTDIEKALRLALDELIRSSDPARARAVLLMTDGEVDLRAGKEESAASVQRIRGPLARELLQENVEIYCVAFSTGADLKLLGYLSDATHGLCVRGEREENLQRLFVRLFEEMAQPQTAPVTDGEVLLDASVREATFLLAHAESQADAIRLTPPGGKALSRTSADRLGNIHWFSAPSFDLITVEKPQPGKWRIAPPDPEGKNRVVVLTDLELVLDEFNPVSRGNERRRLLASLNTRGETVRTPELLSLLSMRADLQGPAPSFLRLTDDGEHGDGQPQDGLFGANYLAPSSFGSFDIEITARTPTLERRIVRTLNVVSRWFHVEIEREVVAPGQPIILKVVVEPGNPALEHATPKFEAAVRLPDASRRTIEVIPTLDRLYAVSLSETQQIGEYRVTVTGTLQGEEGILAQDTVGPLDFLVRESSGPEVALPPLETPAPAAVAAAATPEPALSPAPEPAPESEPPAAREETGAAFPLLQAAVFTALVILAGLLAFLFFRRGNAKAQEPFMAYLRKRVAEIREEEYEAPGKKPVGKPEAEKEETPKPELERLPVQADNPNLIPEVPSGSERKAPVESLVRQVAEESPSPAEKGADKETLPTQMEARPDSGEPARSAENGKETPAIDALPKTDDDLLAEILAKTSPRKTAGPAASAPEREPAKKTPEPGKNLTGPEENLLAEILEVSKPSETKAARVGETPSIPDQLDGKSDQEAIDDILKQIEGMPE